MKNLGKLAVLGAVLAASASFAYADGITGQLNYSSTPSADMEYSGTTSPITLTFGGSAGTIGVPITGTFATAGMSGTIANSALFVPSINLSALPSTAIFTAVSNGTTVTFTATSDSVAFNSGQGGFFDVTFYGTINETGYTATAGTLALDTDDLANTFESYSGTLIATPTPEPSSLILLGTGLVSAAGMLVRKRRIV